MSYSETRGQLWGLLSSQDWRSSASALTESRGPRKYVERSSWCHREVEAGPQEHQGVLVDRPVHRFQSRGPLSRRPGLQLT